MIHFVLWDYAEADFIAEWQTKHFAQASISSGRTGVLTDKEKKSLLSKLQETAKPKCAKLGLEQSVQIIEQIEYWLARHPDNCLYQDIAARLDTLWRTMVHESKMLQFAYIPPDKVRFFEQDKLFGDAVFDAFQESRADVKDAGNCLAADLPTAAVYYLMRVAEIGLRKLTKGLQAKLPYPIEFATWGQAIGSLEKQLDSLKGQPKTKARESKLQYYSALVLDIKAFQYLWRNPTAHTRAHYDHHNALSAFEHVRTFMQTLAQKR